MFAEQIQEIIEDTRNLKEGGQVQVVRVDLPVGSCHLSEHRLRLPPTTLRYEPPGGLWHQPEHRRVCVCVCVCACVCACVYVCACMCVGYVKVRCVCV